MAGAQIAVTSLWALDAHAHSWETCLHAQLSVCNPHQASLCNKEPLCPYLGSSWFPKLSPYKVSLLHTQLPQSPNAVGLSNLHVFAPNAPHLKWPCRPLWKTTSSRKSFQPTSPTAGSWHPLVAPTTAPGHRLGTHRPNQAAGIRVPILAFFVGPLPCPAHSRHSTYRKTSYSLERFLKR